MSNEVKTKEKVNMDPKYIIKLTVTLLLTCMVVAGLLGWVNSITKDKIAAITWEKTVAAMQKVIEADDFSDAMELTDDMTAAATAQGGTLAAVYQAQSGGQPVGYAINVEASGSQGTISMMVGLDTEGAVTGVSCTVLLDGYDYDYGAAYASQPLPAPDGTLPTDTYQVNGLTLLVYDDGAVGWYDTFAGIQWYCVAWDGGAPLVTAFTLMDAQYYTVPTAPEGADVLGYDLFDLNGETVTEVSFTLNSVTWHYRMAPTLDVSETIPDISAFTGGSLTAEGRLRWCPTVLRWDAGGAGCIIWRDIAPGLAYSLTADTGASEKTLADMAALVFKPAQEES